MSTPTSSNKKTVSFPEEIVSVVYSVESYDEADLGMLFYSQDDFRRFKLERRIARNRNGQRIAYQKNRVNRRGVYDCLTSNKKESVSSRIVRMNRLMMLSHQQQQQLVETCI